MTEKRAGGGWVDTARAAASTASKPAPNLRAPRGLDFPPAAAAAPAGEKSSLAQALERSLEVLPVRDRNRLIAYCDRASELLSPPPGSDVTEAARRAVWQARDALGGELRLVMKEELDLGGGLQGGCPLGRVTPCDDCTADVCRVTKPGAEGGDTLPVAPVQPPAAGNVTDPGNVTGEPERYRDEPPVNGADAPKSAVAIGTAVGVSIRAAQTGWADEKSWAARTFGSPESLFDHGRHFFSGEWLPDNPKWWHYALGIGYHVLIGLPLNIAGTTMVVTGEALKHAGYAVQSTSNRIRKGLIIWGIIGTLTLLAVFYYH
jgi:hypothetical protein